MWQEGRGEPRILCVLALVFIIGMCVFQMMTTPQVESFGSDSSYYIGIAENLIHSGKYEFNNKPHTIYPPGLPVVLGLIGWARGVPSYEVFIAWMPVFMAAGLLAWFFVLRSELDSAGAFAAVLLVASSPYVYGFSTRTVLSDTLYFALSGVAILCVVSIRIEFPAWQKWLLAAGAGAAVIGAVMTRSVGLALCGALVAWVGSECLRQRRWSPSIHGWVALGVAAAGLSAFLAWSVWSKANESPDYAGAHMASYTSQLLTKDPHRPEDGRASLVDVIGRIPGNAVMHTAHLGTTYLHGLWVAPVWYSPIVVLLLMAIGVGTLLSIAGGQGSLAAWYLAGYASLYLIWPFDEGQRFMLPVAPLAFVVGVRGARAIGSVAVKRSRVAVGVLASGSLLIAAVAVATGGAPGAQASISLGVWLLVAVVSGAWLAATARGWGREALPRMPAAWNTWARRGAYGGVALLAAVGVARQVSLAEGNLAPDPAGFRHAASVDAAGWLRGAPPGIVMAQQDAILHRLTKRTVVSFPISSDEELIASVLRARKVRYLVVCDRLPFEYFEPDEEVRLQRLEKTYPGMLRQLHRGPGYRVFEVLVAMPE